MHAYPETIVCKFGRDPTICLREEAICAKVYRRTDGQTDRRRTPRHCISSFLEWAKNYPLGLVYMSHWNCFVCGQSSAIFFSKRGRGSGWSSFFYRCSIYRSVMEIFAIEFESCQKSRRNLEIFWPSEIVGGKPSKSCTRGYHPSFPARRLEEFREDTPPATKLLRLILSILSLILNFRD